MFTLIRFVDRKTFGQGIQQHPYEMQAPRTLTLDPGARLSQAGRDYQYMKEFLLRGYSMQKSLMKGRSVTAMAG